MGGKTPKSITGPQAILFLLLTRKTRRVSYDELVNEYGLSRGHMYRPVNKAQEVLDELAPGLYTIAKDKNSEGKMEIVLKELRSRA